MGVENTQTIIPCHGRKVIYSSYDVVTKDNVVEILNKTLPTFKENKLQIIYLDEYRKGKTPILLREKKVRPDINNKINVNFASMIVNFKVGYLLNEPVQYVSRGNDKKDVSNKINELNNYMYIASKEYYDKELAENFSVCGTAYRLALPSDSINNECPFEIYDIRSESAFVVYYSGLGNKPLLGVIEVVVRDDIEDKEIIKYCCYSENEYFEVRCDNGLMVVDKVKEHSLKMIPLIEYPNNSSRLGDFELVLPLLDAIDLVYSNRLDGVEQFVQSLMKFVNVDISYEDFEKLKDLGAIKIKSNGENKADVEFITNELHQSDVEVLLKSLYEDILYICGMPSVGDGNTSDSSNNGAVIMKNGWQGAETRAKATELIFKKSEKEFLKNILNVIKVYDNVDLNLRDIDIKLPRRNYENISQKTTVLTQLLGSDKVHPKLAFESCGLFTDPEVAYIMSKNYTEQLQKLSDKIKKINNNEE